MDNKVVESINAVKQAAINLDQQIALAANVLIEELKKETRTYRELFMKVSEFRREEVATSHAQREALLAVIREAKLLIHKEALEGPHVAFRKPE